MKEEFDFERYWLDKLSACLDEFADQEIRKAVMAGSEQLNSRSDRDEVISWSRQAMERLDSLADQEVGWRVMLGCACQYPKADLQAVRRAYETTGDVAVAHQMLQERFEAFLRDSLQLEEQLIAEVVRRGWGLAGLRSGNTILATKIPKSGYLAAYLEELDPAKRRQYYCHCPRIRDILTTDQTMSATYCYCGAGYYKGLWEEILQAPVEVELLESVLKGDEVCKVAIHLPLARH
jgi:hypothetical protein